MSDEIVIFLKRLLSIVLYVGLGAAVSWIYYYLRRRDLLGGYIGGLVVGVIGALIGGFILDRLLLDIAIRILRFLVYDTGVNLIAGFLGAYGALYIMNRLNHNKERRKY